MSEGTDVDKYKVSTERAWVSFSTSHLTWTPWRQRRYDAGSWRVALCSWSWGSLVWCPHAPTAARRLWATIRQYSRHCIPTTSSTTYVLHKYLNIRTHCAAQFVTNKHFSNTPTQSVECPCSCCDAQAADLHQMSTDFWGLCTWWKGTQLVCLSSRRFHWGHLQGLPGHRGSQAADCLHCLQCCHHPDWRRRSWRWSWGQNLPLERPATPAGNQGYLKQYDDNEQSKCANNVTKLSSVVLCSSLAVIKKLVLSW